jgi:hypothetical protein
MDNHEAKKSQVSPLERVQEVDLGAQLADLNLAFYRQSLLLSALLDLLIEKGWIRQDDLAKAAVRIDQCLDVDSGAKPDESD